MKRLTSFLLWIILSLSILVGLSGCTGGSAQCPPSCISVNLISKNWEKQNLKNSNFTNARLSFANLKGADLSGSDLRGADLQGANLNGANLKNTKLVGANLREARLVGVNLDGADLSGADLSSAILIRVNLSNIRMDGCKLVAANLAGAELSNAQISGSNLQGVNLNGANLTNSQLSGNDMQDAQFNGANLISADLSGSNMASASLIGAQLGLAKLSGAYLNGAILDGTDLRLANLHGAHLQNAHLSGASLDKVDLSTADLAGAKLNGSVFTNANLSSAKLSGMVAVGTKTVFKTADLAGASFSQADFSHAYIAGVTFRGALIKDTDFSSSIRNDTVQIGDVQVRVETDMTSAIQEESQVSSIDTTKPSLTSFNPQALRFGESEGIIDLNPFLTSTYTGWSAFRLIYDSLYDLTPEGNYIPNLAKSVDKSEDGKVYTIEIPDNVVFHDGKPLTAEDVAFTLRLYELNSVAIDNTTLTLTLDQPIPDVGVILVDRFVLPKHIWEPYAADRPTLKTFINTQPIGSGPYKVMDFRVGEYILFNTNKAYWKAIPKIDEMVWITYRDQDGMVAALLNNKVDAIFPVPIPTINLLKSASSVTIIRGQPADPTVIDICFNQIDPKNCPASKPDCGGHPALRDVRVRQALAHATNKDNIITTILSGMASRGYTLVPDDLEPWFNTQLQDYDFDIDKANKMLDDAGYVDSNSDAIRDDPKSKRQLIFNLWYPSGYPQYMYTRLAELLSQDWSKVGIRLVIKEVAESALLTMANPNFEHDVLIWSWGFKPSPRNIFNLATTKRIGMGTSDSGYSNPEYDTLYDELTKAYETDKMIEISWKLQELLMRDVVYIIPYYSQTAFAYRTTSVKGWPEKQKKIMPFYIGTLNPLEKIQ